MILNIWCDIYDIRYDIIYTILNIWCDIWYIYDIWYAIYMI